MIGKKIRITTTDLILLAGIGAAVVWLLYQATVQAQYRWNWQAMPQYLLRLDAQSGRVLGKALRQPLLLERVHLDDVAPPGVRHLVHKAFVDAF